MNTLHVCRFPAANASRLKMQLDWLDARVMDNSGDAGTIWLGYGALFRLLSRRECDLLIFHMQSSLPYLFFALLVASLVGSACRFVYDIHDLNELPRQGRLYLKLRYGAFVFLEFLVFRLSRVGLMTVSKGLSRVYFRRYGRSPAVVYNIPKPGEQGRSVGDSNRQGVVYFGLIDKVRIPLEVLEEVAASNTVISVYGIVRETDPAYLDVFNGLVKRGLVAFKGPYSPSDLGFLYGYAWSLLLFEEGELNIRYCLPNKLFQSLSAGVPCLCSPGLFEVGTVFKRFPDFVRVGDFKLADLGCRAEDAGRDRDPSSVLKFVGALYDGSRRAYLRLAGVEARP